MVILTQSLWGALALLRTILGSGGSRGWDLLPGPWSASLSHPDTGREADTQDMTRHTDTATQSNKQGLEQRGGGKPALPQAARRQALDWAGFRSREEALLAEAEPASC